MMIWDDDAHLHAYSIYPIHCCIMIKVQTVHDMMMHVMMVNTLWCIMMHAMMWYTMMNTLGMKYAHSNLMLDWSLFLTLVFMKEWEFGFELSLIFHIHTQFKFMLASKQSEKVYSPRWLSLGSSSQCTQSSWTLVGVCLYWLYYCKFENINEAMRVYFNHWKLVQ